MSAPKHTPGEWKLEGPCFDDLEKPKQVTGFNIWCDGKWVAMVLGEHVHVPREECEANARLFMASPELLESLKWALLRIRTSGLGEGECFAKAEADVAKAEGRTE